MSQDRLITLAIHTYDKALVLKKRLESEGINPVLNNVNLSKPTISSGVRVRILEKDLPLALRIVENPEIFGNNNTKPEQSGSIIVPTDFSEYSYNASLIAFKWAQLLNANISILHSYISAHHIDQMQLNKSGFDIVDLQNHSKTIAEEKMVHFSNRLTQQIKNGNIPPINFSTKIVEGVPEDAICEYAKQISPRLIVMGTRGSGKKEKELIGSVTGEVLDSCKFPVFAVPELNNVINIEALNHIIFFCNIDQEDIIALDVLYRTLPLISLNITIVNVPHKDTKTINSFISSSSELLKYCTENYPRFKFSLQTLRLGSIDSDFKKIEEIQHIDLIAVPNKKRNVFARFFNPSLAHKILLHIDIPMITIPI